MNAEKYAEIMSHIGVIEMALTLLLSKKQIPDDLREDVLKALSDMTITAMNAGEENKRTCTIDKTISWDWMEQYPFYYEYRLSCGHVITSVNPIPPRYCEECGAKVIGANHHAN